jgi:hypothetical protein
MAERVVGTCGYCEGPVSLAVRRGALSARCDCGRSSIPAAFMAVAAIPRAPSTARALDRLARRLTGG